MTNRRPSILASAAVSSPDGTAVPPDAVGSASGGVGSISGAAGSASDAVGISPAEEDPSAEAAVPAKGAAVPSGGDSGSGGADDVDLRAAERARRRRLDRIFGSVLPEVTEDDRGDTATGDDWYDQNRPPHHDAR